MSFYSTFATVDLCAEDWFLGWSIGLLNVCSPATTKLEHRGFSTSSFSSICHQEWKDLISTVRTILLSDIRESEVGDLCVVEVDPILTLITPSVQGIDIDLSNYHQSIIFFWTFAENRLNWVRFESPTKRCRYIMTLRTRFMRAFSNRYDPYSWIQRAQQRFDNVSD